MFNKWVVQKLMNESASPEWRVEMQTGGRDGYIGYYEGSKAAAFYWELGGGDALLIIHIGEPSKWRQEHPWGVDRRSEIMRRVIQEVVRRKMPASIADTDEQSRYIYLRQPKLSA